MGAISKQKQMSDGRTYANDEDSWESFVVVVAWGH
jgi:hypothetical protein